jgi:hypothetical protein
MKRYGVIIPGAFERQRHDSRRKTPKPKPKPLMLFFTLKQLRELSLNVQQAIWRHVEDDLPF